MASWLTGVCGEDDGEYCGAEGAADLLNDSGDAAGVGHEFGRRIGESTGLDGDGHWGQAGAADE